MRQPNREKALSALERVHEKLERLSEAYYDKLERDERNGWGAAGGQEEDAAALGQREGQLPHDRQIQRGDDPRHHLAHAGHVHDDGDEGHPGRRRGE